MTREEGGQGGMPLLSRHRLLVFLKGMAMGAADSVPGVSGGTVALISNIYEELVDSIRSLGWPALAIWKAQGFRRAWRHINGDFLVTLLAGILCSLLTLGRLILNLMDAYLPYLLAFFAGLVLASIRFVAGHVGRWRGRVFTAALAGAVLALLLVNLPIQESGQSLWYFFLCGTVAVCAMILPGISGAFILVLLGAYEPMLAALTMIVWPTLLAFAAGCLCGLVLFSRLLSWLLHHQHELTMGALTGMLAGSVAMLWPWQLETTGNTFSRFRGVMPDTYFAATGMAFSPLVCLLLMVAGVVLVLLLEFVAGNLGPRTLHRG